MNKKELTAVVVLILLIPVWLIINATFIEPLFPKPEPLPTATPEAVAGPEAGGEESTPALAGEGSETAEAETPVSPEVIEVQEDEERAQLENEALLLEFSSHGGALRSVTLKEFPNSLEDKHSEDGKAVELNFGDEAALALQGAGLSPSLPMEMSAEEDRIQFKVQLSDELQFVREVRLLPERNYELEITDSWVSLSDREQLIPEHWLWLGTMTPRMEADQRYGPFLGVDSRHLDSGVKHYVKRMTKQSRNVQGLWEESIPEGVNWFTAKDKFFTQVLSFPSESELPGSQNLRLQAEAGEKRGARLAWVRSASQLGSSPLPAGATVSRSYGYYVGPVDMPRLRELGMGQEELIDFRLFRPFVPLGKLIMSILNGMYAMLGNWGLAIIMLTVFLRMIIWPISLKGTKSMKKMSELAPEVKKLREKYKDDPQKLNQETTALYKKHKVNPMAGCIPMLFQMPIFFAMYSVLRVAVQFRFSEFLWVDDLSQQESIITIGGFPLNILPITMTGTMIIQQRMTPNSMDEQQKKIMQMMPIMFLFFTYSMPAGLTLYMTTSNLISIFQSWYTRRSDAKKEASKGTNPPAKKSSKK